MTEYLRGFSAAYLSSDRRVLGLFRICFGLVLLFDLLRRVPEAARLYANEGVLSNHFLLFSPQASPQFSLLFACSSVAEVRVMFALIGVIYCCYCLGFCTRTAQILSFVALTSLNSRNLFFEDGGISTAILLCAWTLFLPLGDRFSLDALLSDGQRASIAARVRDRALKRKPAISLAVLALLLQASVIYYLNAAHKSGWTWKHGDAIHLVLWQHRVNTPMAVWFAHHEPAWLSPVATGLVRRLEYLMPVLLLFPVFRVYTRSLAFLAAVGLHLGIALMMTLGPFSYAMIALVLLCVPGEAIDALVRLVPHDLRRRLARLRSVLVSTLCSYVRAEKRLASSGSRFSESAVWAREALVLTLMVGATIQVSNDSVVPERYRLKGPKALLALLDYPRLEQRWSMFAPDAPTDDGTLVVDAVTVSGSHVDPFTGREPDFEIARRGLTPHPAILSDYLWAMSLDENRRYDGELKRYLKAWQRVTGRTKNEQITSFAAWWVSHRSPVRGEVVPGPVDRRLLLRAARL